MSDPAANSQPETRANLLAGAASRIITPSLGQQPIFLAGFQGDRRASEVHSDLYVRALALRLDEQAFVLAVCDLIGLGRPDVEDIRAALAGRGVAAELVVACTHTHSGPDTIGLWGPANTVSGVNTSYLAALKQAVVAVAEEALTFCCPVRLRCATARLPGYIGNYRTPGLVDDELSALQFEKPDGEIVATLLNLACHPEVLTGDSHAISADYAGAACQAVEAAVGGAALHVSGALGGMLSPAIEQRDPTGVAAMGQAYAAAALEALAAAPLIDVSKLELRRATFELPLANPIFATAQELGLVRRRSADPSRLTTSCAYVDLGPAQLITVPGELLPRLGFELKAALPGPCRVLAGLADDELGYILPDDEFVTPSDYLNPGAQYEESMSPGPRSGSLVLAAAKALIQGEERT
jgi:hypothetical protein